MTLALLLLCLPAGAITGFTYFFYNSDGTPDTNAFSMQGWPPDQNAVVVVGTNVVYSSHGVTFTNNNLGGGSNAIMPGTYRVFETNQNLGFFVTIPDTATVLPLTAYVVGTPTVYTPGSFYNFLTNAFGGPVVLSNSASVVGALAYTPMTNTFAGLTNAIHYYPATNTLAGIDFALGFQPPAGTYVGISNALGFGPVQHAEVGTIAARNSNDFALATSVGPIATRSTNDFALATTVGPMAIRSTNDFALITADGLSQSVSNLTNVRVITNGAVCFIAYKTNGLPGNAFTNYPTGSTMWTTNGQFYGLTNNVWKAIEL